MNMMNRMNTNTNVFPVKHNTNTNTNVFVNDFLRNNFVNKPPKPPSDEIVRNLYLKLTMFETEMRSYDIKKLLWDAYDHVAALF